LQARPNPIEEAFQLTAYLRKIVEQTRRRPAEALKACADIVKSAECTNYFGAGGHDIT
jgi:hypothetical protein